MIPINQMERMIAYQRACDQGFSPREQLQGVIEAELQELHVEQAEVIEQLADRSAQAISTIDALAQEVLGDDQNSAARPHLNHLNQSVEDLKKTQEHSVLLLERVKTNLQERNRQNHDLGLRLISLQQAKTQELANSQINVFLGEVGRRAPALVSKSRGNTQ